MIVSWIVILPPIIALSMSFITRRIILSLFLGIASAALIATNFSLWESILLIGKKLWITTELGSLKSWSTFWTNYNLFMCIFLIILGIIIALISHTGAIYAYSNFIGQKIKSKKKTEVAILTFSSFLFIDDYFGSLTTGSVMRSVTDKFKIPRAKLAYLVDSMASPWCVLIPISSWFAAIIAPLRNSGITDVITKNTLISTDTFWVYLKTLPFIFYSIITVASLWFIVLRRISFGSMAKHEQLAEETGNVLGGKKPLFKQVKEMLEYNPKLHSIWGFIFPVSVLFISVFSTLLYSGKFYLFGGKNGLIEAFQDAEISIALFIGSVITLIVSILYFFIRKKLTFKELPEVFLEGINLMRTAIVVLILAWTLGEMLKTDLNTGAYLANVLIGKVSVELMPLMFFIASMVMSLSIGSSWGTMAVMIPIAVSMLFSMFKFTPPVPAENLPMLFPLLGGIISGGVIGDHISPLSDTTIMAASSSRAYNIDHVNTQITYSLPIIFASGAAFAASGYLIKYGIGTSMLGSLGLGLILSFSILKILNYISKKK